MKKNYSELSFTDDFMFCKVLVSHPNLCKELLELLLGIEIRKIEMAESQKTIEMQTTSQKDLPKRSRYYQGMVDLNLIERGAKFKQIKNTTNRFFRKYRMYMGNKKPRVATRGFAISQKIYQSLKTVHSMYGGILIISSAIEKFFGCIII